MSDSTLEAFAQSLAPPAPDRTEVSARRAKIQAALGQSSLAVGSMFESGSWSHGTSVKAHSDVDYMAVAGSSKPFSPSSALSVAKAAIANCDWKINSVAVSSPVVAVTYYQPPNFEIAPAWYKERKNGFDVYWIGGRGDEWVLSAPRAHLEYVNRQNDRLGKKVKPLVRLIKAWKYHATVPVSSFYLEMRTAQHAAGESSIVYEIDLVLVLNDLIAAGARDMNDPEHIAGRIPACSSEEKRRRTLALAEEARTHLNSAEDARKRGDRLAYWREMAAVFGTDYPW